MAWSVSSAVLITDGVAIVLGSPLPATRASSSARARRLRPPTAQASAMRLGCLLAGQPLCHHERPEAAFLWRVRQHGVEQLTAGRRPASSDDGRSKSSADSQLARAGLPTNPKPALAASRGSSVFSGARGRALDECLPRFFHAAISSRRPRLGIAIGSVCEDTVAVVAATRRICAAIRRGARISIDNVHGVSTQAKAINSSTVLLARRTVVDGASKRQRGRRRRAVAVRPTS